MFIKDGCKFNVNKIKNDVAHIMRKSLGLDMNELSFYSDEDTIFHYISKEFIDKYGNIIHFQINDQHYLLSSKEFNDCNVVEIEYVYYHGNKIRYDNKDYNFKVIKNTKLFSDRDELNLQENGGKTRVILNRDGYDYVIEITDYYGNIEKLDSNETFVDLVSQVIVVEVKLSLEPIKYRGDGLVSIYYLIDENFNIVHYEYHDDLRSHSGKRRVQWIQENNIDIDILGNIRNDEDAMLFNMKFGD